MKLTPIHWCFQQRRTLAKVRFLFWRPLVRLSWVTNEGDTIEWPVPSGVRRLKVDEILYQPEAAGNYEL